MIRGQRLLVSLFASALLALSVVGAGAAQPPINIGGPALVNVQIGTIEVNVPVAVAANLCDINVALLVADFRDDGDAECEADAESIASPGSNPGAGTGPINIGGPGLVNVQIGGLFVDLPIGIAANLCDINAAVLVGMFTDESDATCTATADSIVSPGPGGGNR